MTPTGTFWDNLFKRWSRTIVPFLEISPFDSSFVHFVMWAGLQLDDLLRGFLYVLCLRSQGCNPLIFGDSELMTKWFKRLHGASVTRLKLHKWRLSSALKCTCFSLEEPVLPVQSNLSVSCEHRCFPLQILTNVDFTGNADTEVFLTKINMDILSLLCKKKKKTCKQSYAFDWFYFLGLSLIKQMRILNQIQNNYKRIIMVSLCQKCLLFICLSLWCCFSLVVY